VRAVGRTLKIDGGCEYGNGKQGCNPRLANALVTAVMRDLPNNTQLQGDVFIPNDSTANPMGQMMKKGWFSTNGWDYVLLAPNADVGRVLTKTMGVVDRGLDPKKLLDVDLKGSQAWTPTLAPFRDDHLSTDQYTSLTPPGSWAMVYGFAAIGALILLVACFNFTNLATARAMVRAREISLRKVVGATRRQLVAQFLSESVLTALLSLVLALVLVETLLPTFDRVAGKPIKLDYLAAVSYTQMTLTANAIG